MYGAYQQKRLNRELTLFGKILGKECLREIEKGEHGMFIQLGKQMRSVSPTSWKYAGKIRESWLYVSVLFRIGIWSRRWRWNTNMVITDVCTNKICIYKLDIKSYWHKFLYRANKTKTKQISAREGLCDGRTTAEQQST